MTTTSIIIGAGALLLLILLWAISLSNRLTHCRNQADQAFASVDAYLKKRFDLIPNLVASVQQYMGHEKEVLTEITALRAQAMKPDLTEGEKIGIHNKMNRALRSVNVAMEHYPQLKSNENILQLQAALNEVEEQLSAARRAYNAAVTLFNNGVQLFPSCIVAAIRGFRPKAYFEALDSERANINVHELFNRRP